MPGLTGYKFDVFSSSQRLVLYLWLLKSNFRSGMYTTMGSQGATPMGPKLKGVHPEEGNEKRVETKF
jgi:hypothetical protein